MEILESKIKSIFKEFGLPIELAKISSSNRHELCDYQCNGCLAASKILKQKPYDIALQIIRKLNDNILNDYSFEAHENGYINIKIKDNKLFELANKKIQYESLDKTILIDYSSPNIAKSMHVGHLRSTLIGNALYNIYKFVGYNVIGDNHIGDFGTPMGIIVSMIINMNKEKSELSIEEIEKMYIDGSLLFNNDEKFKNKVLENTKKLQDQDNHICLIWKKIINISLKTLKNDYSLLNIHFDQWNGESKFHGLIEPMIEELKKIDLLKDDNGSQIIELEKSKTPLLLTKSNGSYLYSTTDLACLKTRTKFDKILYVVDVRQSLHFSQLFEAGIKAGYINSNQAKHISFGTINGKDNKPFKTRNGDSVKLQDLIQQAIEKSKDMLKDKGLDLDKNAEIIGIGALKFEELKHSRHNNYIFDIDSFLSYDGNTGSYLMYSGIRAKSILNKHSFENINNISLSSSERQILLKIIQFKDTLNKVISLNEPHHLCDFLYELSSSYNKFYKEKNVQNEQNLILKNQFLIITDKFYSTLLLGLNLLGIDLPDKM